jgi:hypothetical protein
MILNRLSSEKLPPLQNKYLHQKIPKPVLKLTRVEVVEILSVYLVG